MANVSLRDKNVPMAQLSRRKGCIANSPSDLSYLIYFQTVTGVHILLAGRSVRVARPLMTDTRRNVF